VDGYLRYESRFHGIYGGDLIDPVGSLVPIPGYVSVDGRLAYRLTDHLTLAVSGQNLFDSPQRQTSAPEVERRVFATLRIDF
jgi:outer membrane receptor protein involved in Fe transport